MIQIEDNYGKVIDYHYDALLERVSRREEFPHDYITIVPEREENTDKEYNISEIINKAQASVNSVIDDQYFCTISAVGSNTKVIEEEYVNDITKEHTQILQIDKADESKEVFTYGLTRLSSEVNDKKNHHIISAKLDVVGVVDDLDETWLSYDIDGSSQTLSIPRFGYSSELHDGSLQYLRARYYDTELGVFISQDTYRGEDHNQLSQNRYIYTENNNVNAIDPSGHIVQRELHLDGGSGGKTTKPPKSNNFLGILSGIFNAVSLAVTGKPSFTSSIINGVIAIQNWAAKSSAKATAKNEANKIKDALYIEISIITKEMEESGASPDEIARKRLEIIRKYCEIFNLEFVDLSESLTAQEVIRNSSYKAYMNAQSKKGTNVYDYMESQGMWEYVHLSYDYNPDRKPGEGTSKVLSGVTILGFSLAVISVGTGIYALMGAMGIFTMGGFLSSVLGPSVLAGGAISNATLISLLASGVNSMFIIPNINDPAQKQVVNSINSLGQFLGYYALVIEVYNALVQGMGNPKNLKDLDLNEIADEIVDTNKKYSNGYEQNSSVSSNLNSSSYYDTPEDQFSSVMRGLRGHTFTDGNKRTMFDTFKSLSDRMNLNINMSDNEIWDIINRISGGDLNGVENIRRAIFGN